MCKILLLLAAMDFLLVSNFLKYNVVSRLATKFTILGLKSRSACGESKLHKNTVNCHNILAKTVEPIGDYTTRKCIAY